MISAEKIAKRAEYIIKYLLITFHHVNEQTANVISMLKQAMQGVADEYRYFIISTVVTMIIMAIVIVAR